MCDSAGRSRILIPTNGAPRPSIGLTGIGLTVAAYSKYIFATYLASIPSERRTVSQRQALNPGVSPCRRLLKA